MHWLQSKQNTVKLHCLKLYGTEENPLNNTGTKIQRLNYIKKQWLGLPTHFNISIIFKKSIFKLVFFVHRCIRMFNIFSFLFHISHSLRWKTRKCLLYSFFFLSLSAGRPEPETEQRSGGHADQVQCYLPYFITVYLKHFY